MHNQNTNSHQATLQIKKQNITNTIEAIVCFHLMHPCALQVVNTILNCVFLFSCLLKTKQQKTVCVYKLFNSAHLKTI